MILILIAFALALAEAFAARRWPWTPSYGWLAIALYFLSLLIR